MRLWGPQQCEHGHGVNRRQFCRVLFHVLEDGLVLVLDIGNLGRRWTGEFEGRGKQFWTRQHELTGLLFFVWYRANRDVGLVSRLLYQGFSFCSCLESRWHR